ncbi:complement C3 isoform X2 [Alligator sinensis]|uniref:Complement C3 isoform X2 n=1 Tax=Alligator sinensis TaxID=38654 RepID=A0A3Q0GJ37_ALLSI|nr:complement C3 isoform X2 [Alligator sinensis]
MGTGQLHVLGLLLLLLLGPQLAQGRPLYLLAAPNVLRTGSHEMVVVQAQDPDGGLLQDVAVTIRIFDFPARRQLLSEAAATLSSTGSFLAKAMVQVPANYISSDPAEKQYLVVQAQSSLFLLEKTILVSPHTGYLFFQTDKAIYTPGQSVRYRILSVNHMMDPLETTCVIAIQNPEGITLTSNSWQMVKGFYTATFWIPEQSTTGTWKIVAWFQQSPQQPYSTEFEDKEYVLPAFEVELVPDRKFLYLDGKRDREVLTFTINARFMFNEPVDGYALAIFGVRTETQRNSLRESLQRVDVSPHLGRGRVGAGVLRHHQALAGIGPCGRCCPGPAQCLSPQITQGTGTATLTLDVLHNAFKNPEELVDAIIFINVTVFSAGGDTVLAEKSGVRIARTSYRIQFFRMPGFFKPGMPFSIRVYVTSVDESPAVGVCICSEAQQSRTTEEGLAFLNLNTAAGQKVLEIEVQTCEAGLIPDQQVRVTMTAHAYQTQSGSGNLLHIQADLQPPSVGSTLQLLLQIGQPNNNIKQFTILVLSKGQIVGAWVQPCSQGSTVTGWGAAGGAIDAAILPCRGLLLPGKWRDCGRCCVAGDQGQLHGHCPTDMLRSFRPDGELRLMVTGDARALVGLVAVDQALLTLGKKNKLTQKKSCCVPSRAITVADP